MENHVGRDIGRYIARLRLDNRKRGQGTAAQLIGKSCCTLKKS